MNKTRKTKGILTITVFAVFAIIFALISFGNHYLFRTRALDLGLFNHAIYYFAHFKNAVFTLAEDGNTLPFLGTHFSLLTALYSPLYYLFGSYTLLVVQILAILFGGFGIYKYSSEQFDTNSFVPLLLVIHFLGIWAIYSALSFDFHNSVVASMLVVWFVYYLDKRKIILSFVFLALILMARENMAIWLFFIVLGLMIKNRKRFRSEYIKIEIPALILCVCYGIAVNGFIMPWLQGVENNLQLSRYTHLGDSFGDVILTFIKRPWYTISLLWVNILDAPLYDGIKSELHFMVLVSGGIALLARPAYLIMLLPIYAQKLLSNNYGMWGINGHYSIEFVPILSLALIDSVTYVKKYPLLIVAVVTASTLYFNYKTMEHRQSKYYNANNVQFYRSSFYDPHINIHEIYKGLKLIDPNAPLSVNSYLAPHLAFRDKIYQFPIIKDAEYIVLITGDRSKYPLNEEGFQSTINKLTSSGMFYEFFKTEDFLILKLN